MIELLLFTIWSRTTMKAHSEQSFWNYSNLDTYFYLGRCTLFQNLCKNFSIYLYSKYFQFWKFDNTDTVMLPFACLLNVEFDMLLRIFSRQQFKKGLYDYSFRVKKSQFFFWTSNITPTPWKLNFILPKGTIFLILFCMCNSNPIFSFQMSETKRPIDNQFILTLLSRVPFRWTALSTPPYDPKNKRHPISYLKMSGSQSLSFHKLIWHLLVCYMGIPW